MEIEHFRLLYAYNRWANNRILDQAEKLTPEQLHAPNNGSFGCVHETLVHLMETEYFWSGLIWRGKAIDIDWEPYEFHSDDYEDVAAIRARWAEIESDTFSFFDELTEEGEQSTERIIDWTDNGPLLHRPLWLMMLDVATHATQHRSEIAMALTRYGQSPGEMDLSGYVREHTPDPTA